MNRSLITFCLSAGLLANVPGIDLADVNYAPRNTSNAPAIPPAALQRPTQTPVNQPKTQTAQPSTGSQQLNVPGIGGSVVAYSIPADIGELTLILVSEVNKQTNIFTPNVLVLDQNITPSAFFPSSYLTYQKPGVMSADRLEGIIRLTPALGQRKLYALVSATEKDLQQTTQLLNPAKAYTKGVGSSIPDILDPIARRATDDSLELKVGTNSNSNMLVGPLFGSSVPAPVMVGNMAAPVVAAPAPTSVRKSEPMLNDTESYFNAVIRNAVAKGDANKALKLPDEAEHLGSTSARPTSISNVRGKG